MGILIFGAIALLVVALLVREAGAGRRAAMELANTAQERAVVAVMAVGGEGPQGPAKVEGKRKKAALPRRAHYLAVKVRACDVTLASRALKEAPQSHPNVIGGGGDLVRHVLYEVIGRAARKRQEPYDEASFRAVCEAALKEKGFELLALRSAADVPFADEALAIQRAVIVDCVHDARPRETFSVSALELYLDAVSKLDQWQVRAAKPGVDGRVLMRTSKLDEQHRLQLLAEGTRVAQEVTIADLAPVSHRSDAADSAASAG